MAGPMTVLNVAEKNSVAREVTRLLCNGNRPQELNSCATYCKNFQFPFTLEGRPVNMLFSSVAGHLLELEFVQPYNRWHACRPADLFNAPVQKQVSKGEGDKIRRNLQTLARRAQQLVLWLDCDREGENIAFEVIEVCREVNPRLVVKRARFSALIQRDILHAVNNLVAPNANESAAVDARQEIDLRVGSSFTRLQTLVLQDRFDWTAHLPAGRERMLLSYGPCQFPTLGLIVQREWQIQAHVSEPFWTIKAHYQSAAVPPERCTFNWTRGRLFDRFTAEVYHGLCNDTPTATVTSVQGTQRRRWAPEPLHTLEMQKKGSQALRLSGERIMKLAEELYQGGYVSYPRTETNTFAQGYDLQGLVSAQADAGAPWSPFAARLAQGAFRWPKNGGKDDGAHPPIHPTRPYSPGGGANDHDKGRLYEFVVRHFLACCAPDAEGLETRVEIDIAGESFNVSGLMVTARNWLEVYPYTRWGGEGSLPVFTQGETFQPTSIQLQEGATQPPPRMREADLLSKMDEYGIGTDATVADHIAKQLERGYALKDDASLTFAPTPLGEALISAYRKMGLSNLWEPRLRGIIETNITSVARGIRTKDTVLAEAMDAFSSSFSEAAAKVNLLEQEVRQIVFAGAPAGGGGAAGGGGMNGGGLGGAGGAHGGETLGPCPRCGTAADLVLLPGRDGSGPCVACTAPPALHGSRRELPARVTQGAWVSDEVCATCPGGMKKVRLSFTRALLPPTFQHMAETTCCVCCDQQLAALLRMIGPAARRPQAQPGRGRGAAEQQGRGGGGGGGGRGNFGRRGGGGGGAAARGGRGGGGGRGRGGRGGRQ